MKKTIIALLALAGLANADTTIDPLKDLTWTFGAGTSLKTKSYEDGSGSTTSKDAMFFWGGSNTWAVYGSTADLGANAITLSKNQVLKFSYKVDMSGADSVTTFSLLNTSSDSPLAVSMGHAYKYSNTETTKSAIRLGSSTVTNTRYVISDSGDRTGVTYIKSSNFSELDTPAEQGEIYSITFTVAYNTEKNKFIGTLGYDLGTDTEPIDLGDSFSVDRIVATFDGNTQTYVTDMALTVTTLVPEPTTATLSLLALAGLAARRRRR